MNKTVFLMSLLLGLCLLMVIGCGGDISSDVPDGTESPELPCCGVVSNGCPEECEPCCTPPTGQSRYWADYMVDITGDGVTGISGEIETRWGNLCGYPDLSSDALSCAYIGLVGTYPGSWKWVQAGYSKERWESPPWTEEQLYFEAIGIDDTLRIVYTVDSVLVEPPLEGQRLTYQILFNDGSGEWYFSVDDCVYDVWEDRAWGKDSTVGTAVFACEIMNKEDDMFGTLADSLEMRECALQAGTLSDFQFLSSFRQGQPFSDDSTNWGIVCLDGNTICIWDCAPIP